MKERNEAQIKFNQEFKKKMEASIAAAKAEFEANKNLSKEQIAASLQAKKAQLAKREQEKNTQIANIRAQQQKAQSRSENAYSLAKSEIDGQYKARIDQAQSRLGQIANEERQA